MDENKLKLYDFYAKVFLGILGLIITILISYIQYSNQSELEISKKKLQVEQNKFQMIKLVNENLAYLNDSGIKGKIANNIVTKFSSELSEKYDYPEIAQIVSNSINDTSIKTENIPQKSKFIVSESTESLGTNKEIDNWFCVIGTFAINDKENALKFKNQNAVRLTKDGKKCFLYKTFVSNNYAVTINKKLNKKDANILVNYARQMGIANDAFAQIDRNWQFVE